MDKPITTVFVCPANPVVTGVKIEDWVSEGKEPDQATILAVSNKESDAAAKAL